MNDRSKRFLAALRRGNKEERVALLQEMPPSSMRDTVTPLLESENPGMQVMALNTLVTAYGFGQSAELAGDLARAAYPFARQVYEQQGPGGPLLLFTVSAIASGGLHALNLIGHYAASVEFADEVVPDLESLGEDTNLPDIYAHTIEALIGSHRMDEASRLLEHAEKRPRQSVHLARLRKAVDEAMGRATKLPPPQDAGTTSMTPEAFRALDRFLSMGEAFLTKSSQEMNEWKAHGILRRIGQLFLDGVKGRDPVSLTKALEELAPLESWARASGHTDVHNDTLWEVYLCHSRLGASSEAADALQDLRRNVEKRRAGIGDPLERAGAGAKYPHLYPALCQMLFQAGRIEELLGAIEAAKGRAVADVMASRAHQLIDEIEFAEPAARMGELMSRNQAHYLSFLVDDDNTLAVLVCKDGSLHASDRILLGKERIRQASRYADPRLWGQATGLSGPSVENISEVLEPLVAWLEPYYNNGVIEDGDHLCYSPDEHLHQIPLAYVRFMGEPLARKVSISRTHGARALSLILRQEAVRPGAFLAVEVPARQDPKKMVRHLRIAGTWLAGHLPGKAYRDEEALVEAICRAELAARVVHFATHGVFPVEDDRRPRNPFEHSGLALAGADGLPDLERLARQTDPELLTPERALAAHLDLTQSHVVFQGCVTGLAREGIGGDALGLDWASFQLGASSLLASHWNVSAELSAEFSVRFYRSWLEQGNSRATAWRETVLSMMGEQSELADPYAWAAFSLSGDWR